MRKFGSLLAIFIFLLTILSINYFSLFPQNNHNFKTIDLKNSGTTSTPTKGMAYVIRPTGNYLNIEALNQHRFAPIGMINSSGQFVSYDNTPYPLKIPAPLNSTSFFSLKIYGVNVQTTGITKCTETAYENPETTIFFKGAKFYYYGYEYAQGSEAKKKYFFEIDQQPDLIISAQSNQKNDVDLKFVLNNYDYNVFPKCDCADPQRCESGNCPLTCPNANPGCLQMAVDACLYIDITADLLLTPATANEPEKWLRNISTGLTPFYFSTSYNFQQIQTMIIWIAIGIGTILLIFIGYRAMRKRFTHLKLNIV